MYVNVREMARMFRAEENAIERWVADRGLPAVKVNGRLVFNRPEVLEWAGSAGVRVPPDLAAPWSGESGKPTLATALAAGGVHHGLRCSDRDSALAAAVARLVLPGSADRGMLLSMIRSRESAGSTGVGSGIALPHPNRPIVLDVDWSSLSLFYLDSPVDFGSVDGKPVGVMFMMISPTVNAHLHLLSRLAFAIREESVRAALDARAGEEEIAELFRRTEAAFA